MLTFLTDDIFSHHFNLIVNPINCVGKMGAGLAYQFRIRYPGLYQDYITACDHNEIKPGGLWLWRINDSQIIANLATKNHWRYPSKYEWIDDGLASLRHLILDTNPGFVSIPAIGCGEGGLEWSTVRAKIKQWMEGLDCQIKVFKPVETKVENWIDRDFV